MDPCHKTKGKKRREGEDRRAGRADMALKERSVGEDDNDVTHLAFIKYKTKQTNPILVDAR